MVWNWLNRVAAVLALSGFLEVAGGATSACGETNVGVPLKGIEAPAFARNSDEVIQVIGTPFFAKTVIESETGKRIDLIVYVDGFFKGNIVRDASDPSIVALSRGGCGVKLSYRFFDDGKMQKTMSALTIDDLTKLHAVQTGDSSWSGPLP